MSERKQFDVRKEMLARPNEWVGAYQDYLHRWVQVGFDADYMRTRQCVYGYKGNVVCSSVDTPTSYDLDNCIPIEDVPEEEGK